MKRIAALVLILSVATFLMAQTEKAPRMLQRGSVIEVKGLRALPIGGIRYGGPDGFLFKYDNDRTVRYASFNGQVNHSYDQGLIPKYAVYDGIIDYSYADGDVYTLTYSGKDDKYISRYSFDGTYQSSAKIEVPDDAGCAFMSYISQGELLLNCFRAIKLEGKMPNTVRMPYTAIIRTNGTLVKELTLPKDVTLRENDEQKEKHDLDARTPEEIEIMLDTGYTDQDAYGNVLLSRYIPFNGENNLEREHPILYIIKHDGHIARVRLPASGKKNGGIVFARLIDGKIVSVWTERNDASERYKTYLRVFDFTGKKVGEWQYNILDFGNLVVQWNPEKALFITQTGKPVKPSLGLIEALNR